MPTVSDFVSGAFKVLCCLLTLLRFLISLVLSWCPLFSSINYFKKKKKNLLVIYLPSTSITTKIYIYIYIYKRYLRIVWVGYGLYDWLVRLIHTLFFFFHFIPFEVIPFGTYLINMSNIHSLNLNQFTLSHIFSLNDLNVLISALTILWIFPYFEFYFFHIFTLP